MDPAPRGALPDLADTLIRMAGALGHATSIVTARETSLTALGRRLSGEGRAALLVEAAMLHDLPAEFDGAGLLTVRGVRLAGQGGCHLLVERADRAGPAFVLTFDWLVAAARDDWRVVLIDGQTDAAEGTES